MTEEKLRAIVEDKAAVMARMCLLFASTVQEREKYKAYFPVMAEGPAEMILRLRKEIDDMIGLTDYIAEFGVPPTNEELDAMAEAAIPGGERAASPSEAVPAH